VVFFAPDGLSGLHQSLRRAIKGERA